MRTLARWSWGANHARIVRTRHRDRNVDKEPAWQIKILVKSLREVCCAGWDCHGSYLVEDGLDRRCVFLSHCRGNHGLLCTVLLPAFLRGLIRRSSHHRRHTRISVIIRRAVAVPKQKQRIFRGSTIALRCEPHCVEPTSSPG